MKYLLHTAEDLHALGRTLGACCVAGTVIALDGDLGAGKTCFAQGLAQGLGVDVSVPSPTFTLVCRYDMGRLTLWHADLYRVEGQAALDQLALDEALESDGVVAIEWADRFPDLLPADRLHVQIAHHADGRAVSLSATGPQHQALLEALVG